MTRTLLLRLAALSLIAAGPVALSAWSPPAEASSFAQLTLEQRVDASTAIVRGTVLSTWTELDEYDRVWTRARVAVSTTYKGNDLPAEIVVDEMGGTHGGVTMEMPGRAWFSAEEDVLLFLYLHPNGRYVPVQSHMGKLDIRRAPGEDRAYVRTWQQSERVGFAYDGRFLPHPPAETREYLDEVLTRVNARVEAGWDGLPIPGIAADQLRVINLPETRIPR